MRRHIHRAVLLLAVAAGIAGSSSCTSAIRQGAGNSYLIIVALTSVSGAEDENAGNNLQSDVLTNGGVIEDEGVVEFALGLKDAGTGSSPTTPTTNNFITVDRYRVVYTRTDGRNTPGVDVPFPFDGAFTVTVGTESIEANFSIVRVQAKLEAPLAALANGRGAGAISTIAEITFYGRDQTGRTVSVTGRMSVDFADFADPDDE